MKKFSAKQSGESVLYGMDFRNGLAEGETLISVSGGTWYVVVLSGVDAAPTSTLSGPPTINGSLVTQLIVGGVSDVTYKFTCSVSTSLGQILELDVSLLVSDQ